jgi:hypothetical protein
MFTPDPDPRSVNEVQRVNSPPIKFSKYCGVTYQGRHISGTVNFLYTTF